MGLGCMARARAMAMHVLGWARLRRAGMGWDGGWLVGGCVGGVGGGCNVGMSCHVVVGV